MPSIMEIMRRGLAHHQAGRLAQAAALYGQALALEPDQPDALHLTGVIARQTGDPARAVELIERAIALMPRAAEYHGNLANALKDLGRLDEAAAAYRRAAGFDPTLWHVHNSLAGVLRDLGDLDGATAAHHRALALDPDHAEAHNNHGITLQYQEKLAEATAAYRRALELNPDFPEALSCLAAALQQQGMVDEAERHCRRALALKPDLAGAHNNLCTILQNQGRHDEAEASCRRALELLPGEAKAEYNLALCALVKGDFATGWPLYGRRWADPDFPSKPRPFDHPWWNGESLGGRTILVWGEQGIGDEIMFASMVPEVAAAAGHCVVETEPRLAPLFARSFPGVEIVPRSIPPGPRPQAADIDAQTAMGDVGRWLRPDAASFGDGAAYLAADAATIEDCRTRYRQRDELLVGLSWRSGNKVLGIARSADLVEHWAPVLRVPGVRFVNLQYGDCRAELARVREDLGVDILHDDRVDPLKNLDAFAAQVVAMDLVVSIDNSTVHMAGALGVPTWTLLPHAPDWRWLLDREDTPWYASMRLVRQPSLGDWHSVFARVAAELARFQSSGA